MLEDIQHFRDILRLVEPNGCIFTFSATTLCKHFLLTADFLHPLTRRELLLCEVMRACRLARLNTMERAMLLTTYTNRYTIHDKIKSEDSIVSLLEADCGKILDKMMNLLDIESLSYEAMIRGCNSDGIQEEHCRQSQNSIGNAANVQHLETHASPEQANHEEVQVPNDLALTDEGMSSKSADAAIIEDVLDETIVALEMERDNYERAMRTLHRASVTAYNQLQLHRQMFERRQSRLFATGVRKIANTFQYISESLPVPAEQGYVSGLEIWLKSIRR